MNYFRIEIFIVNIFYMHMDTEIFYKWLFYTFLYMDVSICLILYIYKDMYVRHISYICIIDIHHITCYICYAYLLT